jgi:hypothetical protein
MKDWKAAVRNWMNNGFSKQHTTKQKTKDKATELYEYAVNKYGGKENE